MILILVTVSVAMTGGNVTRTSRGSGCPNTT
jgi:hypothetical protein